MTEVVPKKHLMERERSDTSSNKFALTQILRHMPQSSLFEIFVQKSIWKNPQF